MAGTVTEVATNLNNHGHLQSMTWTWLSNASGAASKTVYDLVGTIERVSFIPSSGTAPTQHNVTLLDAKGLDVFNAAGGSLSATVKSHGVMGGTAPKFPIATSGNLTFTVDTAGSAKVGTCTAYFRR